LHFFLKNGRLLGSKTNLGEEDLLIVKRKCMKKVDKLSKWLQSAVQGSHKPPRFFEEGKGGSKDGGKTSEKSGGGPASSGSGAKSDGRPAGSGSSGGAKPTGKKKPRVGDVGNRKGSRRNVKSRGHAAARTRRAGKSDEAKKVAAKTAKKKIVGLPIHKGVTRIIPVGGLEEVGKNSMVFEHENDIVVVDMGFEFPEDELFGVDYVIPDVQYLRKRKSRIRALVITHGHLDHIGALPFVLEEIGFPTIYASKLTAGLIRRHLEKKNMHKDKRVNIKVIDTDRTYNFGNIKVEFFRVNHSIPDALGVFLKTPAGSIVHTGDFKFDFTPADGVEADIGKLNALGKRGVDVMFSDSTNSTKPGHTMSERVVAESLEKAIADADGRILVACFASLIGRMQQIIEIAQRHGRTVYLSGRSIEGNVEVAKELGFIKAPKGVIQSVRAVKGVPDKKVLVLTTGSQGEPMAALSRMATDSHAQIKIKKGDTIVVSASPIIGNEKSVAFLVDNLTRLGARVVNHKIMDVHTSGHGHQEDLKMMMGLVRPTHLVPVHGNYYMRKAHGELAPSMGISPKNVHLLDNGLVLTLRDGKVAAKHEDIGVEHVVIDGFGRGDLTSHVIKEREAMASNGIVSIIMKMKKGRIVGSPLLVTHGFVYKDEADKVVKELAGVVRKAVPKLHKRNARACHADVENFVRGEIAGVIRRKLDRRPLVSVKVVQG
jgi:ribonuclease J